MSEFLPRPDEVTLEQWKIVDEFHLLFYNRSTSWLGYPIIKNPMDLFAYQEIITATRPDTIIECGTGGGGSALYFACLLAVTNPGARIISIDQNANVEAFYRWAFPGDNPETFPHERPQADNIIYLTGNTVAPSTMRKVRDFVQGRVMVVLDSAHTTQHVLDECELYGPLVSEGCYLVVEDINICGHPVPSPQWPDGGPYDAVVGFLQMYPEFQWDSHWLAQYLLSYNAYLRKHSGEEHT